MDMLRNNGEKRIQLWRMRKKQTRLEGIAKKTDYVEKSGEKTGV